MCTIANLIKGAAVAASVIIPAVNNRNEQKDALNYRTSLAINNMKEAKNQAYAQNQLGIEEARKQKIAGLRAASDIMAQNASGGFSVNSGNNLFNYEDTIDSSYSNALESQKTYSISADSYFKKAGDYLNDAKNYQSQKKKLGFAQTALGATKQVANRWF